MQSVGLPVGVGKTHLADALGHQACRQGHRVLFTKTSRLLSDLGGGHADGTCDGRLRAYLQPALLVIDDWAMREFTTQQVDDLYELISERTRAGSMILTSNRAPQDWYALFPSSPRVRWIVCSAGRTTWCYKAGPTDRSSDPIVQRLRWLSHRQPAKNQATAKRRLGSDADASWALLAHVHDHCAGRS